MVRLNRPYMGYLAGAIVMLTPNIEAALVAQGLATVSSGPVTPGAVSTTMPMGRVGIAAGASSVVITNPNVTNESIVVADLSNAVADATALYVSRIVKGAGTITIHVNANATAAIAIDWALVQSTGGMLATSN